MNTEFYERSDTSSLNHTDSGLGLSEPDYITASIIAIVADAVLAVIVVVITVRGSDGLYCFRRSFFSL